MKTEIGVVWQLCFTTEEEQKLKTLLECHRLPPDKDGLKTFILGKLDKPGPPTLSPEMEAILQKGMFLAGSWLKKKAGLK